MPFCKNHSHIYFDTLRRTKKAETVLSLIHATYQAKKNEKNKYLVKDTIAKKLKDAYNLFIFDAGTYSGSADQFESQYTIGHELGIWKNSDLDLTPLAKEVAEGYLTIREYFDIVFLNYIQPINNKIEHLLYRTLKYAKDNNITCISKNDIKNAFDGIDNNNESINSLYNMFLGTSFFKEVSDGLLINNDIDEILRCCDIEFMGKDYSEVKTKFDDLDVYLSYLLKDNRSNKLLIGKRKNNNTIVNTQIEYEELPSDMTIEELGRILLKMYNESENKTNSIHMFGLKYGKIIEKNQYSANALVKEAGINDSYFAEVNKGLRIYDSILNNVYGIKFYEKDEKGESAMLPTLQKRTYKQYSLNTILYGAPGTGKTYSTACYAVAIANRVSIDTIKEMDRNDLMDQYNQLIDANRVVFTTFHQNYGYEDFIQGIRPDVISGNMTFKKADGVFKAISEKALSDGDNNYVIIIDEINRGNISKIFGELITLIEENKRWGEENALKAVLPSGDVFVVPNNLYIIGTMNSADKSISLIDTALRRRFDFVEFVPDSSLVSDPDLKSVLEELNKNISEDLGNVDLLIGHSYFMDKKLSDLPEIMNANIIPLLYEYFYDNEKKVDAILTKTLREYDYKTDKKDVGRIRVIKGS